VPVRTSLGAMGVAFFVVATISCGNDIIADKFDISLNAMTWGGRIGLLVLPPLAYYVAYRMCIGLQRGDREVLEHGVETGIIKRLPHGEFIEVTSHSARWTTTVTRSRCRTRARRCPRR